MVDYVKPYPGGFRNKGEVGTPTPFTKAVGNNLQDGIATVASAVTTVEGELAGRLSEAELSATIAEAIAAAGGGGGYVDNGDGTVTLNSGSFTDNGDGTITIGASA